MPAPAADVFGIVYIIENAQQFWAELEDLLHLPDGVTLEQLDAAMRRFVSFCAAYHEQYLQSPLQLEHACDLLIASDLLTFHSERMLDLLISDAQTSTDPHCQFILYSILLSYGRRNHAFLRSQKRWQPLLPLLMDNVRVEIDPDVEDAFYGVVPGSSVGERVVVAVPIEAKLRSLSVRLVYEVCRVQKFSLSDLEIFDDTFIDYLFELVEQTRANQDETFNYSVIKLLVALNEQFMLAVLPPPNEQKIERHEQPSANRILRTLMTRMGSSATFGENLIFMLNRADRTEEDLCMQLLVLKLLYLLFTTKGMAEYFYTNDLCVLVDVFLREIGDIDESNESLRHTYLRVLHPLLTKTQLRDRPYKRAQIIRTLEGLIAHESIRDVDPTTKRLVQRCLSGDWCVQFRKAAAEPQQEAGSSSSDLTARIASPALEPPATVARTAAPPLMRDRAGSIRGRNGKASRSAENLLLHPGLAAGSNSGKTVRAGAEAVRHASGDSSMSLPRIATAGSPSARRRERAGSVEPEAPPFSPALASASTERRPAPMAVTARPYVGEPAQLLRVGSPVGSVPDSPVSSGYASGSSTGGREGKQRRPPPAPPKRRKPPPLPPGKATLQGLQKSVFTSMAASSSQPSLSTTGRER